MSLQHYSPNELAVLSTLFAMLLCENLDVDEQNLLSAFLQGVGQSICIINTQLQIIQSQEESQKDSDDNSESNNSSNIDELKKEIDELKNKLKKIEHKIN